MIRPYHLKKGQHPYWIRTIRTRWHVCILLSVSSPGNLLHHFFHHLLQPFHFFHQTIHLCASLARKHKTLPSSLSPCLTTPRAHKMDPTTTVAAYQMLANCYLSLLRCHPKKSITTRWIYNVTKTMDLQSMYTQTQLNRVGLPNPCFFAHSADPVATRWTKPSTFEPTNLKFLKTYTQM